MTSEIRAAIRPVKTRVEDDLIARPGVNAVDIAEKISDGRHTGELSIVVFVDKKVPLSKLSKAAAIPTEIDGIPTDVQEMSIELQPAWQPLDASALVDPSAYPTLAGGISIGPSRTFYLTPPEVPTAGNYVMVGTLGALVRDTATGATVGLTNFHVSAVDMTWSSADRQCQPGRNDGGNPATDEFGTLTRAVLSEHVDGAVVSLDAGRPWGATVTGIGTVNGTATATAGMAVRKRGRTTELTYGSVTSVDFTVSVNYGGGLGTRTLRNQIRIATDTTRSTRFSDHGDSGAVVVDDNANVVGLLFAGSTDGSETFANPIAAAMSELGVTMLTGNQVTPVSKTVLCPPTRLTCPSVVVCRTLGVICRTSEAICASNVALCRPSRLTACATTQVSCLPTRVTCRTKPPICVDVQTRISCLTRAGCVTIGNCPSLACTDPGRPGGQQADYGYGDQDAYSSGFEAGYAAAMGTVDGGDVDPSFWAGYLAALEQAAGEDDQQ